MLNRDAIRTIVGIVGNVISFGLFISPCPTMRTIMKAKSVQEFKSDPYIATFLNCLLWVYYGLPFVKPDTILVSTINACGCVIELVYIIIFFIYSPWAKKTRIVIYFIVEVAFFALVVFITMKFLSGEGRSYTVGIICVIFNIIMYGSPLTAMGRVIKTKSVKYMPFWLSFANFCNGLIWLVYALLKFDPIVVVPNGLGALFGAIQLVVYATYYSSTSWDEDEPISNKRNVELPNV